MSGTSVSQRIEHISVIGGFLDGLQITFGAGLNTIIGARGTGKTTAVEFIGYALDSLPSREHATDERKRIETLVKRNLGGGRISVGIRAKDGAHYNVTRTFGDEPIILDANEQPVSVNLKSGLFRADIYSQNAVESIADRPLFQLDLIDSFAGQPIADIFSREQQLVSTLKANAHQIIPLEREVATIHDELAALPGIEAKLKAFVGGTNGASAEINEAHRLKSLRDRETRSLKQLRELVGQFQESLRSQAGVVGSRAASLVDPEAAKGPNAETLRQATNLVIDCARDVDALTNLLQNSFEAFKPVMDQVGPFWIAVSAHADDAGDVTVTIEDNGIGFGEDDLRQIRQFIPGQTTLKHDGTGFGLPTAKRYIEGHGGSLEIDSQENKGTQVRIRLPLIDDEE